MAKTPLSEMERVGRKVSKVLTDIATKMDAIKASDSIQPFQVPEFDKLDQQIAVQMNKVEMLKKVWKTYGENLEKVARRRAELDKMDQQAAKSVARLVKEEKDLNDTLKAGGKLSQDEQERLQRLPKIIKEAEKEYKALNVELDNHRKTLDSLKPTWAAIKKDGVAFIDKAGTKALGLSLSVVTTGFEYLEHGLKSNYDMMNRFRGAMAAMAETIGVSDSRLEGLQRTAMETYLASGNGLGALGMGLPDITQNFGALATSMQYADIIMAGEYVTATKLHKAFGLTAEEMGNLLRSSKFMNIGMGQLQEEMRQVGFAADKLRMNSRMLTKDVFVLGKNLLDMAGPKWRAQMQDAIVQIRKMGISVQAMDKFTDMTDVFDTTVESMAKLNTAFGLHIDALKMFDEQDPAKRMQMVSDQLRIQGKTYETMTRQQKKFLAQTMGLNMEETNALLQGKDMVKAMEKQDKITDSLDSMMQGLRTTLFNVAQVMDRIGVQISKVLTPMFKVWGISLDVGTGKAAGFADIIEVGTQKVLAFIDSLSNNPEFVSGVQAIAQAVKDAFAWLSDPKNWKGFTKAIGDVVQGMKSIAQLALQLLPYISPVAEALGFMAKHVVAIGIALASWKIGAGVLQALSMLGGGGGAGAGVAKLGGFGNIAKGVGLGAVGGIAGGALSSYGTSLSQQGNTKAGAAASIGGAALQGAGTGAMIGSFIPGIGTAIGAGAGALIGGGISAYNNWGELTGQPVQGKALGGDVQAGVPYMVGEMGRERFVPQTDGKIVPNNQLSQPILVQVILDGEVIQDKMYKANLRSG